jgi:hypothetical protein
MPVMYRMITAATLAAMLAIAMPFNAAAQPELPDPMPFLPGDVLGDSIGDGGSFDYQLNLIPSPPPATTDARGVLVNTNATAGHEPLRGLPGSKLGNTDRGDASASPQGRVTVGNVKPLPASIGINISAGPTQVTLEDPHGRPPTDFTDPEPQEPTVDPVLPDTDLGAAAG